MSVSEVEVREALRAIDTPTLERIADETGFGRATLFRYRQGASIRVSRLRPLARALGLSSSSRSAGNAAD